MKKIGQNLQKLVSNNKFLCSIILVESIVTFLILIVYNPIYDGNNYLEGKKVVESIPFDDLQTSMFLDGTKIVVVPSIKYPKDKIVTYKSVRFPVENHEGKSVVVATYSHDDWK